MSNSRSRAQVPCSASNARNLSRAKHVCNVARSMCNATDLLPEGRLLLCGIAFALLGSIWRPALLATTGSLVPQGERTRAKWGVRGVRQAEKEDTMPQVIVSRNEQEEVWVATPTGTRLAEGFFRVPDEMPDELEHMGYPQLLHFYPPEEIRVGRGIAPEEVEEIFVEA